MSLVLKKIPQNYFKMKTSTPKSKTRLYNIWVNMRQRCSNPNWTDYHLYGGRGISVCSEWDKSFDVFKKWAINNSYKHNLSIDRIDNEKGYFPENCKWSTPKEQARNRRNSRILVYQKQSKTLAEWSEVIGLSSATIRKRIDAGWSINEAFKTPINTNPKNLITYKNQTKTTKEWSRVLGININTLRSRLKKWTIEESFTKKIETKFKSN